jgi:hypothetical protein
MTPNEKAQMMAALHESNRQIIEDEIKEHNNEPVMLYTMMRDEDPGSQSWIVNDWQVEDWHRVLDAIAEGYTPLANVALTPLPVIQGIRHFVTRAYFSKAYDIVPRELTEPLVKYAIEQFENAKFTRITEAPNSGTS